MQRHPISKDKRVCVYYVEGRTKFYLNGWNMYMMNMKTIKKRTMVLILLKEIFDLYCQNVTEQLLCLLSIDKEFVYTDLKPENIVVNCNSHNDISDIYLIDIESVLKDRTNSRIGTYECKQLKDRTLENSLENKKRCIAYLIAVLAYELLVFDLAQFETEFYTENIDIMSKLFEKHNYLIVDDLLHPDIKRVTDALNIIKSLIITSLTMKIVYRMVKMIMIYMIYKKCFC